MGFESLPVKCGKFDGAMFRKTNGILCSLCSSSRRFAFLNSEQNIGNIEKKLKNREFLRYFIGALPDKVLFIYYVITFRVEEGVHTKPFFLLTFSTTFRLTIKGEGGRK